jgi:hypothetical protein
MSNILDVLDHMRERPAMYFGRSLRPVEIFCDGYYAALSGHHVREDAPVIGTFHFGEWLYRRHQWPHSCGWAAAIQRNCASDEEAFDRFFQLLDEYRQLRPVVCAEVWLGAAHKPTGVCTYGSGAWPLPPTRLQVCRYEPEDFYFLVEYYPKCLDDRSTFVSLEAAFADAERLWQVKPEEWCWVAVSGRAN